jgi:hypothetical protein
MPAMGSTLPRAHQRVRRPQTVGDYTQPSFSSSGRRTGSRSSSGPSWFIALGISDYEQAVDPDEHEHLRYRDGFGNPMPPYLAAKVETNAKRLDASAALLAEAGVAVKLDDLQRGHFRLKRPGAQDLRLEVRHFHPAKIIETTNWHQASNEHFDSFLDGDAGEDGQKMFKLAATLVAWDLHNKGHKELRGRRG